MKRKSKVAIGAGIGLGLLGTGALIFERVERRQKEMLQFEYEGIWKETEAVKELSAPEKEKISDMIKGMDESELRVVLQNIPVGLMFDEVLARMSMYNNFASSIQDSLKYLPK